MPSIRQSEARHPLIYDVNINNIVIYNNYYIINNNILGYNNISPNDEIVRLFI